MPVGEKDDGGRGASHADQDEERHRRDDEGGAALQVLAEAVGVLEARQELHRIPVVLLERQILRERGVDRRLRGLSIWRRHLGLPVCWRHPAYEPAPDPAATIYALSPMAYLFSGGMPRIDAENVACAAGSTGRCLTLVLAGS